MPRKNIRKRKKYFWKILACLITTTIASDLTWYFFIVDIKQYENKNPAKTAIMKYRERQWKDKKRAVRIRQQWVSLGSVSSEARRAVVVAEDAKFWQHDGFDFEAMRKAMEKDLKKRKIAVGASTITMQVAKNMFLSPSKTPVRKINEAILTWRMERTLSKKRIFELYLNIAEWGDGIFGIEAASRKYFNHPAAVLNKREASLLAAVLPNPIKFNPLSGSRFVERRSRLIYRAIGGDIDAAIALHSNDTVQKIDTGGTDTPKDTVHGSASLYGDTTDTDVHVQSVP
jgi:monofunctional glycosyltransferase